MVSGAIYISPLSYPLRPGFAGPNRLRSVSPDFLESARGMGNDLTLRKREGGKGKFLVISDCLALETKVEL